MNVSVFMATNRSGISRAARASHGEWTTKSTLYGHDVRCLTTDPIHTNVVYAGTQGEGVFRSDDLGESWKPVGLEGEIVKSIAVSRLEPNRLYAGTKPPRLFTSSDGGGSWHEIYGFRKIPSRRFWFSPAEPPYTAYVQGIALSPSDVSVILVGIEFGAVVKTADHGESWSGHCKRALRDCHTITFHSNSGDWVYEAGGNSGGAAVSQDAGSTWTRKTQGLDRHYGWACAADPEDPETWYISVSPSPMKAHGENEAEAAIFRSTKSGHWTKLSGGLPSPIDHMPYALLTDPTAPGHLYAGLSNGDVWFTSDYGEAWQRLPFNLQSVRRSMVALYT